MKLVIKLHEDIDRDTRERPDSEVEEFTRFELQDADSNQKIIELLTQVLSQLKTLNHFSTPAKSYTGSEIEKSIADKFVAERVVHYLKEIYKGEMPTLK